MINYTVSYECVCSGCRPSGVIGWIKVMLAQVVTMTLMHYEEFQHVNLLCVIHGVEEENRMVNKTKQKVSHTPSKSCTTGTQPKEVKLA